MFANYVRTIFGTTGSSKTFPSPALLITVASYFVTSRCSCGTPCATKFFYRSPVQLLLKIDIFTKIKDVDNDCRLYLQFIHPAADFPPSLCSREKYRCG